uniref:Ribosomal protein S13 n=1 Tax=Chloroparvula japonica TaxID=1411623 RepID=A0A4D6C4V8_9CHLO|nr:ribosomal protein S13 [Chloroparvula japonica]QBX98786.1 ribosomal protein S13 [Chloroparvula japonica]
MAYLLNTYLPGHLNVLQALQRVHGIGRSSGLSLCAMCGISPNTRVSKLRPAQLEVLGDWIEDLYVTQAKLKRSVRSNVERLVKAGTYRGFRHTLGLPVRGQQTQTNAQTARVRRVYKRKK